jgi:tubulin alpha
MQLLDVDLEKGRFLTCGLNYRGDIVATEVYDSLNLIRARQKFSKWCPTGIRVGINYSPPTSFPKDDMASLTRSLCLLSNNTSIN